MVAMTLDTAEIGPSVQVGCGLAGEGLAKLGRDDRGMAFPALGQALDQHTVYWDNLARLYQNDVAADERLVRDFDLDAPFQNPHHPGLFTEEIRKPLPSVVLAAQNDLIR